MNNKSQTKNKKLIVGGALVLGSVLTVACFPMMTIGQASSAAVDDDKTIYLLNVDDSDVSIGNSYTVRTAYFGKTAKIPVGLLATSYADAWAGITSDVTVTYVSTGESVVINKDNDTNIKNEVDAGVGKEMTYGSFPVNYTGTYRINYSITVGGQKYQMNFDVKGVRSEASMSFESDKTILPSIYDVSYAKAKEGESFKAVALPLPNVLDEKNEKVDGVKYYTANTPAAADTDYVVVTAKDSKANAITLNKDAETGIISIPGTAFSAEKLGTYSVSYKYYSKAAGSTTGAVCLATASKEFEAVKDTIVDGKLTLNVSSDVSAFVTGVENNIPTVAATMEVKTVSGSKENKKVDVKYDVEVMYSENGVDFVETEDFVVDGKFTPSKSGEYKFKYTATDFYGNTAEKGNILVKASDTQAPNVYMYDAGDARNYKAADLEEINEYVSATEKLKTKTTDKNIVLYAVGATDNLTKLENIKFARTLSRSGATIQIDEKYDYSNYNIIFNYDFNELDESGILGLEIDKTDAAEADAWLKAHKYLKAATSLTDELKTSAGIVDTDSENEIKEKLVNIGYALINTEYEVYGTASGVEYTIVYKAKDEAGLETTLSNGSSNSFKMTVFDGKVTSVEWDKEPLVSFENSSFQASYTTKDVISFNAPTVSSEIDDRPTVVTSYRFLKIDKSEAAEAVVLDKDYKIDLSTAPENAAYVEIKTVATTDYNVSKTETKLLEISNINDANIPVVDSVDSSAIEAVINQNSEVSLPTIVYEDDYVAIMNAKVEVYNLDNDGKRIHTVLNDNVALSYSKLRGTATFNKSIVADFAGKYEVVVIASDPANNIITSYYFFNVNSVETESIKLNVSSAINGNGTAKVGDTVIFDTPTVSYNLTGTKQIYGLKEDGKTPKYFSIEQISGPSAADKQSETAWTFTKAGTYKFKYIVNVGITTEEVITNDFGGNVNAYLATQELESDILTLTVSADTTGKTYEINFEDGAYATSYKKGDSIKLYSVGADENVSAEKSSITVSYSGATTTTRAYYLSNLPENFNLDKDGVYTLSYKIVDNDGNEYSAKNGVSSYTLRVGDTEKPKIGFKDGFLNETYDLNSTLTLDKNKIILSDNGEGVGDTEADTEMRTALLAKMKITLTRKDDNGNWVTVENKDTDGDYRYVLDTAGEYKLTVSVKDAVDLETIETKTFTVTTEGKKTGVSTSTIGIILIVISALVLAGVIAYFIVSRVLMNKKGIKKSEKNLTRKF